MQKLPIKKVPLFDCEVEIVFMSIYQEYNYLYGYFANPFEEHAQSTVIPENP